MKKILISTGGSGGHVVPATILYEHLSSSYDVQIVSDYRGSKFIDKNFYKYSVIDTPKISKNIFFAPLFLILFTISIIKSFKFLKQNNIHYLISTGGYMSLPFCIAAKLLKLNIFLFEPNMVIGRSNNLMLRFSKKIFCYHENIINFPAKLKYKIIVIERLLKRKIFTINNKKNERSSYFKILIVGGSQGSSFFDNSIKQAICEFSTKQNTFVLQQISNEEKKEEIKKTYDLLKINYELFSFDENLYKKMQDVDLAITRCGASTLSDLVYYNIPFIGIPFPHAKDNHQYYNGKYFFDLNCCWLLDQNKIDTNKILDLLLKIINDKDDYLNKKKNIEKISSKNNWKKINQKIIDTINEH